LTLFAELGRDFFDALWAVVLAIVPGILTNLISNILANWLNIETDDGTKLVITLAIITFLMYLLLRWSRRRGREYPAGSAELGNIKKQILLQGSLFSLATILSLICNGLLAGPITFDKILKLSASLLPVLEGAIGRQVIAQDSGRLFVGMMDYIHRLLLNNPRVTQYMIEAHAKEIQKAIALQSKALPIIVHEAMVRYFEFSLSGRLEGRRLELNSYQSKNWKLIGPNYHNGIRSS